MSRPGQHIPRSAHAGRAILGTSPRHHADFRGQQRRCPANSEYTPGKCRFPHRRPGNRPVFASPEAGCEVAKTSGYPRCWPARRRARRKGKSVAKSPSARSPWRLTATPTSLDPSPGPAPRETLCARKRRRGVEVHGPRVVARPGIPVKHVDGFSADHDADGGTAPGNTLIIASVEVDVAAVVVKK
jgi:hypothetical protein